MMNLLHRNNMPEIDLHGENKDSANILVREFIKDNYKLGQREISIVHGIGKGILKKEVHKVLKGNKYVCDYQLDNFNSGCTLVKLYDCIDKKEKTVYNIRHNSKGDRV